MDAVVRFFKEGGMWMLPIAFVSFLVLGIAIERVIVIVFRLNLNGAAFMAQIQKLVMANNIDRAIKLCNAAPHAALPKVIKAGLTRANKGEIEIQTAIEEAMLEVMPPLTKRSGSLATLASLSTLLGLLGTVMGLIGAFRAVAKADPAQKSQILTEFIAEAMNCTAFGLMVGIPGLFAHMYLAGSVKKITDELDMYSVKLENLLITRGKGGLDGSQSAEG
jgi:biopolymer transport protein ExbB/TolQ